MECIAKAVVRSELTTYLKEAVPKPTIKISAIQQLMLGFQRYFW